MHDMLCACSVFARAVSATLESSERQEQHWRQYHSLAEYRTAWVYDCWGKHLRSPCDFQVLLPQNSSASRSVFISKATRWAHLPSITCIIRVEWAHALVVNMYRTLNVQSLSGGGRGRKACVVWSTRLRDLYKVGYTWFWPPGGPNIPFLLVAIPHVCFCGPTCSTKLHSRNNSTLYIARRLANFGVWKRMWRICRLWQGCGNV
jgi:hypothetical protein